MLNYFISFSQNELAKKGTITLADNQKVVFSNLTLTNGKFIFTENNSTSKTELSLNEVKYIDDEKMSRIFTNKSVETVEEANKIQENIQLAIIESEKKEMDERLRIMREEAGSLKLRRNGIFKTKEDFIYDRIGSFEEVVAKGLIGFEKKPLAKIEDNCFFYYKKTDEKVKNVFAISYKGHLYFQIYAILENRNKTDRAQTNSFPNSFVRVLSAGENYYYLEADLANAWAQGFAYGGIGGATGGYLAETMVNRKGVVWDIKNKEFNIFKNCKDYNEFIKAIYPDGIQQCEKHQPDITKIREVIEKIK